MKLLWLGFVLYTVFTETTCGSLDWDWDTSKLCQPWDCIIEKFLLQDDLYAKDRYTEVFRSQLPSGDWQNAFNKAVSVCYGDRPRPYTNTCKGQGLMHCVFDQLIQNCPEESWNKNDACAPVSSLAGLKFMFSQSRYENFEKNMPAERRPTWFMKNYFSSKCCNLPELFNSTTLAQCGFDTVLRAYTHPPPRQYFVPFNSYFPKPPVSRSDKEEKVKIVDLSLQTVSMTTPRLNDKDAVKVVEFPEIDDSSYTASTTMPRLEENDAVKVVEFPEWDVSSYPVSTTTPRLTDKDAVKVVEFPEMDVSPDLDPLDCCDMSDFIQPAWRSECDFHLSWEDQKRLTILDQMVTTTAAPTTTVKPAKFNDVKVVPLSCEKETCVFRKLNIVSESGTVDINAFSKLLDNMTRAHPDWKKAKARVVTKCLARLTPEYPESCQINKMLACTFDVLSENCPHAKKNDPCKRAKASKNGTTCQISSSKYRPKHRRQFCGIPNLVNAQVLSECGINSLSRMEYVPDPPTTSKPRKYSWWTSKYSCKDSSPSTKCVLNKMAVLNKYGFVDYFKMKDRIRHFTTNQSVWSPFTDMYISASSAMTMYREHCSTPKKLLNVIETMLMTCPISKRKPTLQCNKLFTNIANMPTASKIQKQKLDHAWKYYHHVYRPLSRPTSSFARITTVAPTTETNKHDFEFLGHDTRVRTMDIKPQIISKKPMVLLPVYLRTNGKGQGSLSIRPYSDGIMRSEPFAFHNQIASAHNKPLIDIRR